MHFFAFDTQRATKILEKSSNITLHPKTDQIRFLGIHFEESNPRFCGEKDKRSRKKKSITLFYVFYKHSSKASLFLDLLLFSFTFFSSHLIVNDPLVSPTNKKGCMLFLSNIMFISNSYFIFAFEFS